MSVRAGPAREGRRRTRPPAGSNPPGGGRFCARPRGGSLPRRSGPSAFLDDDRRRELDGQARLAKADQVARDRYLFTPRARAPRGACTSCARRRPTTARRASRARSGTTCRPSSIRPTLRARRRGAHSPRSSGRSRALRPTANGCASLAWLANGDRATATALARAQGWERRFDRALAAFNRPTRLTDPSVLELLRGRGTFGVTELETFAGCSSIWFVERVLDPKSMDAEIDARMRGSIAHQALFKFFSGLPKRLHSERVPADRLTRRSSSSANASRGDRGRGGSRLELTDLQRSELQQGSARPGGSRPPRRSRSSRCPSPFRGLVRVRALGAGAPARSTWRPSTSRGRSTGSTSIHLPRAGSSGTTSRQDRALGCADRERGQAPDPALHAGAARSRRRRAARRPLPAARRRAQARGSFAPPRRRTASPATRATTTWTRRTSGRASVAPRTPRARSSGACATATCTTIRATAHARPGASWPRCAG